ncbi:TonB-dependent receptor plug domain-containing protein [Sphingomonas sp.]|uniref:TonB-dependent receptor plug domain-containing protein n=1 Tax=Sphingomonas sp. TaxID=28214 RepID=UPI002DD6599A|nr:TonB-dependent receptor [Sphingomonas sp.]
MKMRARLLFATSAISMQLAMIPASAAQGAASLPAEALAGSSRNGDAAMPQVADATAPDGQGVAEQDVIVTGTRVIRKGYDAPVPTTVLTTDDLNRSGNANLIDTLEELPQIKGGLGVSTVPASGNYVGQTSVALRGLGSIRTLVMVDGERMMPGSIYGITNISLIPQSLVKRVEVVTGGASAQWGSDALAGVVNLIMDHDFEGVRGSLQGGISTYGDNGNYRASLAWGHRFADDRARIALSFEIAESSGIPANSRDWLGAQFVSNPNATAATKSVSNPLNILSSNVMLSNATFGGLITAGPLRGTAFGPNGTTYQFNYGTLVSPTLMVGGGEVSRAAIVRVAAPLQRKVGYGHLSYDLSDRVEVYLRGLYAHTETSGPLTLPASNYDTNTVRIDNAFLPASVRAQMAANNLSTISVVRFSTDYAMNVMRYPTDTGQFGGGINGSFGSEGFLRDWRWDAHYNYGWTNSPIQTFNNLNKTNYANALDSIIVNGQPVCRNVDARAAGCRPINIFGLGSPATTPDALAYVMGTSIKTYYIDRHNAAATLKGSPFSTWAGPISFAAGVEWRRDRVNITADPIAVATGWGVSSQLPFGGSVSVVEGFAEAVVPLISGQSWTKSLDIAGAVRQARYSTSGDTRVWKVGASWTINDSIRLRANRSRDFRGPALTQLFQAGSSANSTITDPQLNLQYSIYSPNTGNPLLTPEISYTNTAGIVLTPSFLPGLRLSADWYDIRLKGLIVSASAQLTIDSCFNFNTGCGVIVRGADGRITQTPASYINLQSARTSGVDFEAEYRTPRHDWGSLTLRLMGTYLDTATGQRPADPKPTRYDGLISYTGVTDGLSGGPKWRVTAGATWDSGPASFSVTQRFIGGGRVVGYDFTPADYDVLTVDGRSYTDLSLQYRIAPGRRKGTATAFVGVQNLFNVDPPITGAGGIGQVPTDASVYDVIGRQFVAGLRFSY